MTIACHGSCEIELTDGTVVPIAVSGSRIRVELATFSDLRRLRRALAGIGGLRRMRPRLSAWLRERGLSVELRVRGIRLLHVGQPPARWCWWR